MNIPELPSSVDKPGKSVMPPDGKVLHFVIENEVRAYQDKNRNKIIVLQQLKFEEDNRKEIRIGYYILGKKPKMLGRWVWGQYAAMMPTRIFLSLIRKAQKQGWFSV